MKDKRSQSVSFGNKEEELKSTKFCLKAQMRVCIDSETITQKERTYPKMYFELVYAHKSINYALEWGNKLTCAIKI